MAGIVKLRTVLKQAGVLLLAAGLLAVVAGLSIPLEERAEGEIGLAAALRLKPVIWIDARSVADYDAEHVPGALLLNEENWSSLVPKVLESWDSGCTAVVYCSSPGTQASREVAERLRDFKLGPVFVLQGGWIAWKQR